MTKDELKTKTAFFVGNNGASEGKVTLTHHQPHKINDSSMLDRAALIIEKEELAKMDVPTPNEDEKVETHIEDGQVVHKLVDDSAE